MKENHITAIVLAAGRGSRMNMDQPKQFLELLGKPLIYYSLLEFEKSAIDEIILVTGAESVSYCEKEIVERYGFQKVKRVVAGGTERYHSVFQGLKEAKTDYVLIHDGARPMIDQEIIERTIACVQELKACVVGMPVKDTIKRVDSQQYAIETPDRNTLWQVQTPQAFSYELIYHAYEELLKREDIKLTDDAMVLETMYGSQIKLIKGSYENIKVTTREDLDIAEKLLSVRAISDAEK